MVFILHFFVVTPLSPRLFVLALCYQTKNKKLGANSPYKERTAQSASLLKTKVDRVRLWNLALYNMLSFEKRRTDMKKRRAERRRKVKCKKRRQRSMEVEEDTEKDKRGMGNDRYTVQKIRINERVKEIAYYCVRNDGVI